MKRLLLEPAQRIARDLIDKRLWPVAVLLVAAIAVLALVIGGSSNGAAEPAPLASVAPATPGAAAPVQDDDSSVTRKKERTGKVRDPFFRPPKEATASSSSSVQSSAAGSSQAGTTSTPSPRKGSTTAARNPSAPPATPPVRSGSVYYRTVVRWNAADGGTPQAIARLKPLGGAANPAALFMGVTKANARYAVFVLGPRATSEGDAGCKGGTSCRMIGLKVGQSQLVTVRSADGRTKRMYSLHIESIGAVRTGAAVADRRRTKVHRYGRDAWRVMLQDPTTALALAAARYNQNSGLLRASTTTAVRKPAK